MATLPFNDHGRILAAMKRQKSSVSGGEGQGRVLEGLVEEGAHPRGHILAQGSTRGKTPCTNTAVSSRLLSKE